MTSYSRRTLVLQTTSSAVSGTQWSSLGWEGQTTSRPSRRVISQAPWRRLSPRSATLSGRRWQESRCVEPANLRFEFDNSFNSHFTLFSLDFLTKPRYKSEDYIFSSIKELMQGWHLAINGLILKQACLNLYRCLAKLEKSRLVNLPLSS